MWRQPKTEAGLYGDRLFGREPQAGVCEGAGGRQAGTQPREVRGAPAAVHGRLTCGDQPNVRLFFSLVRLLSPPEGLDAPGGQTLHAMPAALPPRLSGGAAPPGCPLRQACPPRRWAMCRSWGLQGGQARGHGCQGWEEPGPMLDRQTPPALHALGSAGKGGGQGRAEPGATVDSG